MSCNMITRENGADYRVNAYEKMGLYLDYLRKQIINFNILYT